MPNSPKRQKKAKSSFRVGFQGASGAFSEIAIKNSCKKDVGDKASRGPLETVPFKTFAEVFAAVDKSEVLPPTGMSRDHAPCWERPRLHKKRVCDVPQIHETLARWTPASCPWRTRSPAPSKKYVCHEHHTTTTDPYLCCGSGMISEPLITAGSRPACAVRVRFNCGRGPLPNVLSVGLLQCMQHAMA